MVGRDHQIRHSGFGGRLPLFAKENLLTPKPKQVLFFFLPQKFCGNSAKLLRKSFVFSMDVQGCLLFAISAMIVVALQNNSLIDVLFNRKYCLYVNFIFSVFIFP